MKSQQQVTQQMIAAKDYAQYILGKVQDPNQKFLNHQPICKLCLGTGSRTVYRYGKAYRKRCESATWDVETNRLICAGNSNAQQLETENKKDLSTEIWKIVSKEKLKEAFNLFLIKDYQTEKLGTLLTDQLYRILCMLHSGRLLVVLSSYSVQQTEYQNPKKLEIAA
jgi:hypothetical protein